MFARPGCPIELSAILKTHGNAAALGQLHDLLQSAAMPPASDQDGLQRTSGVERFAYCVDAGQFFHRNARIVLVSPFVNCVVVALFEPSRTELACNRFAMR